jgi:hypothetical protein
VKAGTQEKFNAFRHGRRPAFDITELELSGAGEVGINAGVRINRHGAIITVALVGTTLFSRLFKRTATKMNSSFSNLSGDHS